ncbi:S41 family peptidase [Arenibaculum sp.]|uniref:S41 family peptidase n=1 Tax=Arenibaculum sp. TaxID=2865862 RepID=UPI002E1494BA|nr:S41 family peptidase [Arenibaculum sp.]
MNPSRLLSRALIVLAGGAVLLTSCASEPPDGAMRDDVMATVVRTVKGQYVEPVADNALVEGALKGMLQSLDPHSSYMSEEDFRAFETEATGEFGGIGIEVAQEDQLLKVVAPIDDTPAARAGLRAGDRIVTIDGVSTAGMALTDTVSRLRGPVGTSVTLGIARESEPDPLNVNLTREIIEVDPVEWRLVEDVGYIRLSVFNERAAAALVHAVADLRRQAGRNPAGYVLDLRDDPGGLLGQAVAVTDMFLDAGEIVSIKGRDPAHVERYAAGPGDLIEGAPLVVLINGGSASASEIVAGALQDHGRATILGTRSFGKGSVQKIIPLNGRGALRLTTARYYTPSGRSIQLVGISPDVVVEAGDGRPDGLREANLAGALSNDTGDERPAAVSADERSSRGAPGQASGEDEDVQLDRAVELLRSGAGRIASGPAGSSGMR